MLPLTETIPLRKISKIIKTIDFTYPADTKFLVDIAKDITATCRQVPLLPNVSNANDFIYLVELAISEICTNIIQHAYAGQKGEIKGQITLLNNGIYLDFYDTGHSFDPAVVPTPQSNPHDLVEGGYGLHIVRQIMDVVSYDCQERSNHWHLEKFLRLS
jgi:serine/threonine-protein kinase RsbW